MDVKRNEVILDTNPPPSYGRVLLKINSINIDLTHPILDTIFPSHIESASQLPISHYVQPQPLRSESTTLKKLGVTSVQTVCHVCHNEVMWRDEEQLSVLIFRCGLVWRPGWRQRAGCSACSAASAGPGWSASWSSLSPASGSSHTIVLSAGGFNVCSMK